MTIPATWLIVSMWRRTKPVPEQIQQEGQREPPRHGSAQEPRDGEQSPEKAPHVGHAERRDLEHREEDHDVGDHVDEIRQRDAEHRGEIPPQRRLAHTVAADLRHGVLQEDVDAHDHHDDAAHDAEDQPIRLDRPLQDRREEHGEDRHERIGARPHRAPMRTPNDDSCSASAECRARLRGPTVMEAAMPTPIPCNSR